MTPREREGLDQLRALWAQEREANAERARARREGVPLATRVARGEALADAEVHELGVAPGDRTWLWITVAGGFDDDLRLGTGTPVRLWWDEHGPDGDEAVRGVVRRRRSDKLQIYIDGGPPQRLLTGTFNVDADDPLSTFARGDAAISGLAEARANSEPGFLRSVLFGLRVPEFDAVQREAPLDAALNPGQQRAVDHALAAATIAFVHGPPGTGKTRTLVEVVRRAVARGQRVLACAMSNTATDHLAAGLHAAGVPLVRLGHPARVDDAVESRTLDALMAERESTTLARKWTQEAQAVRRRAYNRFDRGQIGRRDLRQALGEARGLERDARKRLAQDQRALLAKTPVVCATAAGADSKLLSDEAFDYVVLDEATQAPDPLALVALARAPRVVLAGDPEQLPPTIIDPEAERAGLGRTLFERLAAAHPAAGTMLTEQYRMHADLMAFPSETRYRGELTAHPSVAGHTLAELGVLDDPLRPGPLLFVDTAGKGWSDERDGDDGVEASTRNPGQAERTAAEVRRLLSRGLPAADVAVITPYRAQRRLLRGLLADELAAGLEIGTVDGFQGREKEAILVDLVRSNDEGQVGFVADRRRLNVAFTRARRWMMVIGDTATLGGHADFAAFLETVEARGAWISAWSDEAEPL